MDLIHLSIPYSFACERAIVSWRDIRFGLSNGLLEPKAPIDKAIERVVCEDVSPPEILELAGARCGDFTSEIVGQLADGEPECLEETFLGKWAYLVLAWFYEHRDEDPDPLGRVEAVYADFGYPEEIESFVRYMPSKQPVSGSHQEAVQALFDRWRQYIEDGKRKYGCK